MALGTKTGWRMGFSCEEMNTDTNYGGHNATLNGQNLKFVLQRCEHCGLEITAGYWDPGFCNCGEMMCPDRNGVYDDPDEINYFRSLLELGRTYRVTFGPTLIIGTFLLI